MLQKIHIKMSEVNTKTKCTEPGCDNGWINIQHPLKPPGVIMQRAACSVCNADMSKPDEWFEKENFTISYETGENMTEEVEQKELVTAELKLDGKSLVFI